MDLIQVHVAWNDEHGNPDKLVAIEFGNDCELCALETDVLDGDPVDVCQAAFVWFLCEDHRARRFGHRFVFEYRARWVGNICWDMLYMTPEQCGRFAEHMQRQKHWSLNVAADEFWHHWGSLSGTQFVELLTHLQEAGDWRTK